MYAGRRHEAINPFYWVDTLLHLPAAALAYIGVKSDPGWGRLANVIAWIVGIVGFITSLPDFGLSEVHFALSSGCRSLDLFLNPINLLGARGLPERSARQIWAGTSQPWFRHSTERGGESLLKVESSYTSGKCALLMIKTNLIRAHGA